MPLLKRLHLIDVSLDPEQAIALAEIFPEIPMLAHVNLMENPKLTALASAKDEANQEEACAFYASLMAAVRVSKSIMCVDVDVPIPESSEVIKALAKQVVAYCLRNMERGPVAEYDEAISALAQTRDQHTSAVPDVLLHLVGHVEGFDENHDDDEPAPNQDYVIGSQGVIKALGICLNKGNDSRRPTTERANSAQSESGRNTPMSNGKAKDMSTSLLGSARKIRARLQPAILREARTGDEHSYSKCLDMLSVMPEGVSFLGQSRPQVPGSCMDWRVLRSSASSCFLLLVILAGISDQVLTHLPRSAPIPR